MAQADLRAFLVERLRALDVTQDLTDGSPADVQVIQPVLRRLGPDPFTVDIGEFLVARINQAFPDLSTRPGDALTDLIIETNTLLWEPITREITRVKQNLSFQDPTILTLDEAEALGANLYAVRNKGDYARIVVRMYFAQPQSVTVNPTNAFSSKGNLLFLPTEIQSISVSEMILNTEDALYYFDVSAIAENPGDQYNVGPDEIVSVTGLASAIRVTNKIRARAGTPDEDAVTFIDRAEQELTERSMVTERGITAVLTRAFPEVTRLASTGFNDPEMQRDVLEGGGLGQILAAGSLMTPISDGENATKTRRLQVDPSELSSFNALIAATGAAPAGYTLTLHNAFVAGDLPRVRDLRVRAVVDATTLDLEDQVLSYNAGNVPWVLRKNELTLSKIPGGILFPDTPAGTVSIPNGLVHIGGATDVHVRGTDFDETSLLLTSITDDDPILQGTDLGTLSSSQVVLNDFVLGTSYAVDDTTYSALVSAKTEGLSLQILDVPNAASYRILDVAQSDASSPILTVTPSLLNVPGSFRWRLTDTLDIDLIEPKETKIAGDDLRTVQGDTVVDTAGGVDFDALGVAPGDILRVLTGGLIEGDYPVVEVVTPSFDKVRVDRTLPATVNGARYVIFRANKDGGLLPPFIRIKTIDLLDTSSQPVGATIPFARPVDVQSRGFANVARGVKTEVTDAVLGIVTDVFGSGMNVSGLSLTISWENSFSFVVTFAGSNPLSVLDVVGQVNTAVSIETGGAVSRLAVLVDDATRVGFVPVRKELAVIAGSARALLFGAADTYRASDIHSQTVFDLGGWAALRPVLDQNFDVAQVVDGLQIGFYAGLVNTSPFDNTRSDGLTTSHQFNPEVRRHLVVGARSLGVARVFFLEPTSFEVDATARFTLTGPDGAVLRFSPDPTNTYQRVPGLPSGVKPKDGATGGALAASIFESLSTDFIAKGVQKGDLLVLDYVPLAGSVALADPVPNLATKTFTFSLGGGVNKTVIFVRDTSAIPSTHVSRQGVVDQINRAVGQTICALDSGNHLEFNPDASVIVRGSAAGTSANAALGFSLVVGTDQSNDDQNKGTYVVQISGDGGNPNRLRLTTTFPTGTSATARQQFKVFRGGLQRIVSTDMAKKVGAAGLYYFDVQLISEGTGDQYNIDADQQLGIEGYRSDGYYLTTADPNLAFSPIERPTLHISKSILEVGVSDDPSNATQISGQNILITYERSSLAANVNDFVLSETERVINQSPLARHLVPYFVRFDLSYVGGSKENEVTPDLQAYIRKLYPNDALTVSALERIVQNRGASSVQNPLDLVAVIHNNDRTVTVERSRDSLNTGRLAAFIPDVLNVSRRLT